MKSRTAHEPLRPQSALSWQLAAALVALLLAAGPVGAQQQLDHFMCYTVTGKSLAVPVQLEDEFDRLLGIVENVTVNRPAYFCNPVRKTRPGEVTEIRDINAHLKWYTITTAVVPARTVIVRNQFGPNQTLKIRQPKWLAVPTAKDTQPFPQQLDHYKCYQASGTSIGATVTLEDQFELDRNFVVLKPERFCNPTVKLHGPVVSPIRNPLARLVCYDVARPLVATNQFGVENLLVRKMSLCAPTEMLQIN